MTPFETWWNTNDYASVIDGINLIEVAKDAFQAGWDMSALNAVNIIMKGTEDDETRTRLGR